MVGPQAVVTLKEHCILPLTSVALLTDEDVLVILILRHLLIVLWAVNDEEHIVTLPECVFSLTDLRKVAGALIPYLSLYGREIAVHWIFSYVVGR